MNNVTYESQHREYIWQHVKSFGYGMVIGGLVSDSLEGALAAGCVNALVNPEIDSKVLIVAAAIFSGIKVASLIFINRDLTILTPVVLALFNEPLAKNALFLSGLASIFNEKVFTTSLKKAWEISAKGTSEVIDNLLQNKIGYFTAILWSWGGVIAGPKGLVQSIMLVDLYRKNPKFGFFQKPNVVGIALISGLILMASLSAKTLNYLKGEYFGDAKWIIPPAFTIFTALQKEKVFLMNFHKYGDGLKSYPPSEGIDQKRALLLLTAESLEEVKKITEATDAEILNMKNEYPNIEEGF